MNSFNVVVNDNQALVDVAPEVPLGVAQEHVIKLAELYNVCLLYTSDAADE